MMRGKLLLNEPLAKYTSWRVGGTADRLYIPYDKADLIAFVQQLPADEPLFFMGLGSNLLVRDGGIRGTVINTKGRLKNLNFTTESAIYAEAGVPCAKVAKLCIEQRLGGAEFFAGIPGTMGGALKMNAGAWGSETWSYVQQVEILNRRGEVTLRNAQAFTVGYRSIQGMLADEWFLSAILQFPAGDSVLSQQMIKNLLEQRANTQPTNQPSCGSVFKNPAGDYAARLIEQAGLKGMTLGGAQVSTKHANFIVNTGNATAVDIETLIAHIQETVQQQCGICLQTEVCRVGETV